MPFNQCKEHCKKVDDFKILLIEEGYDMVFVTESWTQAHIGDAEINVEGYDLFRKDRKTSRGGGCLIFTKKHLKITLIEDLTFNFESESVWCMCKTCDYELAIGVCYRNPSACDIEEENLHDCIKVACDRYKNIIIVISRGLLTKGGRPVEPATNYNRLCRDN